MGLLVHSEKKIKLIGDKSLSKRDFKRITEPLQKFGAKFKTKQGKLPITIFGTKKAKPIKYLEYEYYEGMAEAELKRLANNACKNFTINHLYCRHRVGKVKPSEISIHIIILSRLREFD